MIATACASSCSLEPPGNDPAALFAGAPRVRLGARPTTVADVAALGTLEAGRHLRISVESDTGRYALVLLAEDGASTVGLLVGGTRVGQPLLQRVDESGFYYVFIVHEAATAERERSASVAAEFVEGADVPRPARQVVYVDFENGFLTSPGLWDPVDGTEADRLFLESITPTVRDEVVNRLRDIFADTPIDITDTPPTEGSFATITFSPDRVLADQDDINDAALPPPDPTRPECQVRVVFGEMLPRGIDLDPGNQVLDDIAVVYVGSFQGRGQACWTSAVSSLNAVVLTLAQTAAHEIGHLVGLFHVEQIDLMNRSATLAFLRDLEFARGQIQLDRLIDGRIASEVFPAVVQEPARYFHSIFDTANDTSP